MDNVRILRGLALTCIAGVSAAIMFLPTASADDVENCGDLIICIKIPGSGGSAGGGGGSTTGSSGTAGGGGGSEPGFTQGGSDFSALGASTTTPAGNNGNPQAPTDAEVATMAVAELRLRKPTVHMTPETGKLGLVGLPVWLWIESDDPHQWTQDGISKKVTDRGVTVTATARSPYVTWSMGDGTTITCHNPGTKYDPSRDGGASSTTCGHQYSKTSLGKPNERYTVTATVHWNASYVGSDNIVHLLPDMLGTTSTTARIGELQVIN
jgi:hypothetical protein